jgi:hypothetical protein
MFILFVRLGCVNIPSEQVENVRNIFKVVEVIGMAVYLEWHSILGVSIHSLSLFFLFFLIFNFFNFHE